MVVRVSLSDVFAPHDRNYARIKHLGIPALYPPMGKSERPICGDVNGHLTCTRRPGHGLRHAAAGVHVIIAVWDQP